MGGRYRAGAAAPVHMRSPVQHKPPVLADEVLAEAVVGLLVGELEAGALVDRPGGHQYVVGPEHDRLAAGAAREAHALSTSLGPTPRPRASGSTRSSLSWAVIWSLCEHRTDPTARPSTSAIPAKVAGMQATDVR